MITDPHTGMFYLCARRGKHGYSPLLFRISHRQPSLETGEVAIQVNVSLPRVLFQKPILKASVTVPADGLSPAVVEADVINNIEDTIRQNLGIEMTITLGAKEET